MELVRLWVSKCNRHPTKAKGREMLVSTPFGWFTGEHSKGLPEDSVEWEQGAK